MRKAARASEVLDLSSEPLPETSVQLSVEHCACRSQGSAACSSQSSEDAGRFKMRWSGVATWLPEAAIYRTKRSSREKSASTSTSSTWVASTWQACQHLAGCPRSVQATQPKAFVRAELRFARSSESHSPNQLCSLGLWLKSGGIRSPC